METSSLITIVTISSFNCAHANIIDHKWWFKEHDGNGMTCISSLLSAAKTTAYARYALSIEWKKKTNQFLSSVIVQEVNGVILISTLRYMLTEWKKKKELSNDGIHGTVIKG